MNLLVDMNLSPRWIEFLAREGINAVHWSTVGQGQATDAEIMAHAKAAGWIVLTHDLDFGSILAATGGDKPSVVQIRADDVNPEIIGKRVAQALHQTAVDLEHGALITIDPAKTRVRVLPLPRAGGQSASADPPG